MSLAPPFTDHELSTAEALAANMRQRGKRPSDLNDRGQALLRRFQMHLASQGYSSYDDYARRRDETVARRAIAEARGAAAQPKPGVALREGRPISEIARELLRSARQPVPAFPMRVTEAVQRTDPHLTLGTTVWQPQPRGVFQAVQALATGGPTSIVGGAAERVAEQATREVLRRGGAKVAQILGRGAEPAIEDVLGSAAEAARAALRPATRFPKHPAGQPAQLVPSSTAAIKPEKFGERAKQIITAAQRLPGEVAQRRGVLSDKTVDDLSRMIGIRADELARLSPGSILSAEHVAASRRILKQSAEEVFSAAEQVSRTGAREAEQVFEQLWRQHVVIQQRVAGLASETGRALRQFRRTLQEAPTLPELDVAQAQIGNVKAAAERVLAAGREKAAQALGELAQPTWRDMLVEFATAAKVSGPLTQLRNTVGNAYAALIRPVERTAAGAVDFVRSLTTGAPRERFAGEAVADLFGKVSALRDASRNFVRALAHESFTSQTRAREIGRLGAIPGRTGRIVRLPFRWMAAVDEFFREINRRGATLAEAYRAAARRGLRGQALIDDVTQTAANPTEEIAARAAREASEYLFQDELSAGMRAVMRYRNSSLVARLLFPFFRTPVNLVKFVAERSPVGVILPRNVAALRAGGGEAADAVARVMVGSMLMGGLTLRAAEGHITGAGPKDPKMRDLLRAQGWQPYSVKIGDRWMSYRGFDPPSQYLANAANLIEIARNDAEYEAKAWQLIQQAGRAVTDATWLQGLRDVLDAVDEPERYGQRFVERFAGGFVPRLLAPVTQALDPTIREAETIPEAIQAQLPGLSRGLPPRLDVLGRPIEREGGPLRGLMPSVRTPRDEPALAELVRHGVGIPEPSRSVRRQGKTFAVPEAVRRRIIAERGRRVLEAITRLIHTPHYRNLTDEQQRLALQRIVRTIAEHTQPAYRELSPGR